MTIRATLNKTPTIVREWASNRPESTFVDSGATDYRNRKIGWHVMRWESTVVEAEQPAWRAAVLPSVTEPVGTVRFCALIQTTRNGDPFGASQSPRKFATVSDREAWIRSSLDRRLESAVKKGP